MAEPADIIVPMLREIRSEIAEFRGETKKHFDIMERRFKKLEEAQGSYRQALSADSLLSKLVTGEFEERIEALEQKVRQLEGHK